MEGNNQDYFLTANYQNNRLYAFFIQKNENILYVYNQSLVQKGQVPSIVNLDYITTPKEKLQFLRASMNYQNYIMADITYNPENISIPKDTAMPSSKKLDTLLSANYK